MLDWESHKSLKHDRECLTELLECKFFPPYLIQWIQLAEVGWESNNKGFDWKRLGGLCNILATAILAVELLM